LTTRPNHHKAVQLSNVYVQRCFSICTDFRTLVADYFSHYFSSSLRPSANSLHTSLYLHLLSLILVLKGEIGKTL